MRGVSESPLVLQFAMAGEAAPFLAAHDTREVDGDRAYGFRFHEVRGYAVPVIAAVAGEHPRFGCDAIGTIPAALLTHAIVERFAPARLVNAGTAGGFEARGGQVGDVYLGAEVAVFHDRRIPLGPFEAMGVGRFPIECDRGLAARLGLKCGVVSTGDSLDCTTEDLARMQALESSVKEMEAASIAWVCEHRRIPLVLVKAITDLVDHPASVTEQFTANYALAVHRLAEVLRAVVDHYAKGKP